MDGLKILIADDHEVVRQGLRAIIKAQPGLEIVGEAENGRQAVALAKELNPHIVVLDLAMPSLNGLEATKQILKACPQTKVLILTMHESDPMIREVLDAGARGYILKTDAGRDLISAIEALRRNKTFFTSRVSQMILDGFLKGDTRSAEAEPAGDRLTGAAAGNRTAAGGGKKQQGSRRGAESEREDRRDPSRQHHAQAAVPQRQRSGPLRHPQQHHRSVNTPARTSSVAAANLMCVIPILPQPPAMGAKTSGSSSTNAACCPSVSFRFP